MQRAFSLVELIVVVIIIGILASIAMPNYLHTQERALDNEAKANLKLIQAAEKIYRMEEGFYYPFSGTADTTQINTDLKLSIPGSSKWSYSIPTPQDGGSQAQRNGNDNRIWTLGIADAEPH